VRRKRPSPILPGSCLVAQGGHPIDGRGKKKSGKGKNAKKQRGSVELREKGKTLGPSCSSDAKLPGEKRSDTFRIMRRRDPRH